MSLNERLEELRPYFSNVFSRFVTSQYDDKPTLGKVIRYALSGKGKRIRPMLTLLSCESLGNKAENALPAALAIELIHTYSLVHDDLPCMDDDDTRRGRPSTHCAFDEARALLAGDGMLTDAFSIVAGDFDFAELNTIGLTAAQRVALVRELACAAGGRGMVRGQALDLFWTARQGATREDLDDLHMRKTGYIIGAASAMGAICADADDRTVTAFREFGRQIGLAYQVIDDLLDESDATGKTAGKDKRAGKLTYLSTMSASEARELAEIYTKSASSALATLGKGANPLVEFADRLLARVY